VLAGALLSVGLLSFVAAAYHITKLPDAHFLSRIHADQVDFSAYSSFEEAALALQIEEENFLTAPLTLVSERGQITTSLGALGVDAQSEDSVQYLLNFPTDANALDKITLYLFGQNLSPTLTISEQALKTAFAETGIEQGNKDASFGVENGQVVILEEQIGYGIDLKTLTKQIEGYWENGATVPASDTLPLLTSEPAIRTAELESLLPLAEKFAKRSFTLTDEYGDSWDLAMIDHIDWIKPVTEFSSTGAEWEINEAPFITFVENTLVPEVEQDPLPVVITEKEDGSYEFTGSARFGREIDKTELRTALFNALQTEPTEEEPASSIALPLIQTKPEITVPDSLKERGITELVGVGYSTYKTSPTNRIANVNRGFQQFNSIIIEQGAEFSFTGLMGPIDAAHGWLPELVIKGDETIPEYGGGLCQVSSTMFRAALYSGLPITARKNHSYAVSYYAYPYGYGLDATVYDPNPDLRFMNDTPADLLIQGYTDGFDAYFVFYGTNDGRTVTMEGPYSYDYTSISTPQITITDELAPGERVLDSYAHTGFKTDWYRTVLYPTYTEDQLTDPNFIISPYAATASGVRENIHSAYEARPAKYLEGASE
jgi:vancomycin resistance protein YoaR